MLERIIKFSVDHRWIIVLATLLVAALGARALLQLPIDAVPDITNNQVQINTLSAALSPVEIEKQITFPIETALAGIPGLEYTRSLSRNGFSQVTAVFEDSVNIYFARNQIVERLNEAREDLPEGTEPAMGPIATGLGEVYMWAVVYEHPNGEGAEIHDGAPGWQSDGSYLTPEGERLTNDLERAAYLRTVQDWLIRPQLKGVENVAGVDSIGGYVKQYHVHPDSMKLVSFGLTFSDVIEALERNNVSTGAGFVERSGEAYLVRASGRIENEEEIRNVVLGTRHGFPVRVRDVAEVDIGRELRTGSASENGEEAVVGTALMLIGANSRTVAKAVDEKMREINRSLPSDIQAQTVLNRTKLVNATIETVATNLIEGAALVILILFLLLWNIRAALICAVAIPLSMLIASMGMVQGKISGNLMSLGAIDFGLIVDGAVIVVENCLRRLGAKQHALRRKLTLAERLSEVLAASREVLRPAMFGQAIIITVSSPLLTLSGIDGKMFHPMAWTVIFALAGAFVLSITLVPALVAIFFFGRVREKESFVVRPAKALYEPLLKGALRVRWAVVGMAAVGFALSLLLFQRLGQEFIPTLDEQDFAMHAMRIPSTGIEQSTSMQLDVERTVMRFPEVGTVFSKSGTADIGMDPMPPNLSDTFIIFRPKDEWPDSSETKEDVGRRIEAALANTPGNSYEFLQPIQMRFQELIAVIRSDVAVKVYGDEFDDMRRSAEEIATVLRGIDGARDVKVEQTTGLPVMTIDIDRAAIARYGLNVADVQEVVAIAIGGREAGQVFEGDRRFDLMVRLPDEVRENVGDLGNLPVPAPQPDDAGEEPTLLASLADMGGPETGPGFVPLESVASMDIAEGPNQVSREHGKRRVIVSANVRGRDLGSFIAEAQQKVSAVTLPPNGWLDWGGQFENLLAAKKRLTVVVPLCFLLIFMLLFSALNSAKQALLVFTGVPLGLSGGVVALWLRDMPFSISAAVGFIALSGVAVLNGLVMVSFINQLRAEGVLVREAVVRGSVTRLRPVLMTALVASLGFLPMALATSTGAEVQRPLATVVIGGLISSTLLTLFVLPALYLLVERDRSASRIAIE